MTSAALTQFLIDITRGARKGEFAADREAVLADAPLDDALRQAVRTQDVGALWLAGAHPMALMYYARSLGWSNEQYYGCLEAAEARRSAPAGSVPPAACAQPRTHR